MTEEETAEQKNKASSHQFIPPARGKARMNPVFAGDLSWRLATLKFSHYLYLEFQVVASPHFLHLHPSKYGCCLAHCLLGGVHSK